MQPFLTIITPTHKRPQGLARAMASIAAQTAADAIEHLVLPDYVGRGIPGMFATLPAYVQAVHGEYVYLMGDDDELVAPTVVAEVRDFAHEQYNPPVVIVRCHKGSWDLPKGQPWPPVLAHIDLGNVITRADVWAAHVSAYASQRRYEGDFDFMSSVAAAGHAAAYLPLHMLRGQIGRGLTEGVHEPVGVGWSA